MSKSQIKNRAPAPIQITAEQLLREAQERGIEDVAKAPKQFVTDKEELVQYQQTKRKDFEDQLRRQRQHIGLWCRYALWEASQMDFTRARSVFERALDVDYRNQTLWLKYAEMEMKNKFVNHARNVWDRAVTILPRVDSFWYKYSYMEEMIGAIENARQVFERWMAWEPDDLAWAAFIKFEMRQGNIDLARQLYERYIALWPTARAYLKYAKWEESQHQRGFARKVYERSLQELHPQEKTEKLLSQFARFEERCKEVDRARTIYQYAIQQQQQNSKAKDEDIAELKQEFVLFEKRHGNKQEIESVIVQQRREVFEQKLTTDAYDYDTWMDYIRLEESEGSAVATVRAVYDRAVAQVPPIAEKKYWKRYIYLWINYALYEELQTKDTEATRTVYQRALRVVPHKSFTFGKLWLLAAHFEVRQHDLTAARKLLGQALGLCGKDNLYRGYIDLEMQLGEIDRCRVLYSKYVAYAPFHAPAWQKFAALEASVGELSRARAIYELAIQQPELDTPEMLWKAYIDWEVSEKEIDRARQLYERLLDRTGHVKVWISFGKFEYEQGLLSLAAPTDGESGSTAPESDDYVLLSRSVFSRGYEALRRDGLKEERVLLLEAWREMEQDALRQLLSSSSSASSSSAASSSSSSSAAATDSSATNTQRMYLSAVEAKFPRKVKRVLTAEEMALSDGQEDAFYDYIFPDDEKKPMGMAFLEKALAWKQKMAAATTDADAPATAFTVPAPVAVDVAVAAAAAAPAARAAVEEDDEPTSLLGKRARAADANEVDLDDV